ncbi:hypothetical protein DFS34DRAFT_651009 [Phlyctochytrium arcticum]|nr:hypothetical protein DFS34DRAFT_651009 [Phlyctochytrium arcticum]
MSRIQKPWDAAINSYLDQNERPTLLGFLRETRITYEAIGWIRPRNRGFRKETGSTGWEQAIQNRNGDIQAFNQRCASSAFFGRRCTQLPKGCGGSLAEVDEVSFELLSRQVSHSLAYNIAHTIGILGSRNSADGDTCLLTVLAPPKGHSWDKICLFLQILCKPFFADDYSLHDEDRQLLVSPDTMILPGIYYHLPNSESTPSITTTDEPTLPIIPSAGLHRSSYCHLNIPTSLSSGSEIAIAAAIARAQAFVTRAKELSATIQKSKERPQTHHPSTPSTSNSRSSSSASLIRMEPRHEKRRL